MIFSKQQLFLEKEIETKDDVLKFIAEKAQQLDITSDKTKLYEDLLAREKEYPTAVQQLIAIPHAKSDVVKEAKLFFIRLKDPIEWDSPDDFQIKAIFAILVPASEANQKHLKILSNLAVTLLEEDFQEKILSTNNEAEMLPYLEGIMGEELV